MPPLVSRDIFGVSLRGRLIGREGEVCRTVESTMDVALERAQEGVSDGYAVLAEEQRSGRGRDGGWMCPAGMGVLLSVILRLRLRRAERRLLSLLGAVAGCETVGDFGVPAGLKWPNDIVVAEDTEELRLRKLGGVLVEPFQEGDAAPGHVLGLGINVNQGADQLPETPVPATSMNVEMGGREFDRNRFCVRLFERMDAWYSKLAMGHQEALLARWRTLSCLMNRIVRARVDRRVVTGEVVGLRASGELVLEAEGGGKMVLSSERAQLFVGGCRTG